MATDIFLKLEGPAISSVMVGEGHRRHPCLSEGEILIKRVLVFALEMNLVAIACAGTILAIFAWAGASL